VVYPAFPYDAKGLLATAINDPQYYFIEHKALQGVFTQGSAEDYLHFAFGKRASEGRDRMLP